MKKEKWFYSIQKNLDDHLHLEYDVITTQFQDITPDRVYELKICQNAHRPDGSRPPVDVLLCCMTKATNRFSIYKVIEQ
jgi:hypothetical protein